MRDAAAIGIRAREFWKYTLRELYAEFAGANINDARQRQLAVFQAWQTERFVRTKKLPNLLEELRRWETTKVQRRMTPRALRASIIAAAMLSGANVIKPKPKQGD